MSLNVVSRRYQRCNRSKARSNMSNPSRVATALHLWSLLVIDLVQTAYLAITRNLPSPATYPDTGMVWVLIDQESQTCRECWPKPGSAVVAVNNLALLRDRMRRRRKTSKLSTQNQTPRRTLRWKPYRHCVGYMRASSSRQWSLRFRHMTKQFLSVANRNPPLPEKKS
jgi:hypothetical protein